MSTSKSYIAALSMKYQQPRLFMRIYFGVFTMRSSGERRETQENAASGKSRRVWELFPVTSDTWRTYERADRGEKGRASSVVKNLFGPDMHSLDAIHEFVSFFPVALWQRKCFCGLASSTDTKISAACNIGGYKNSLGYLFDFVFFLTEK